MVVVVGGRGNGDGIWKDLISQKANIDNATKVFDMENGHIENIGALLNEEDMGDKLVGET